MTIDHRRPLAAFICVTMLCALVMVQGALVVTRSTWGAGLGGARALVSTLGGFGSPGPGSRLVQGVTVPELPGTSAGTTVVSSVPTPPTLPEVVPDVVPVAGPGSPTTTTAPVEVAVGTAPDLPTAPGAGPPELRRDRGPGAGRGDEGRDLPGAAVGDGGAEPSSGDKSSTALVQLARLVVLAEDLDLDLEEMVAEAERPRLTEVAQLIQQHVALEEPVVLEELVELLEPRELTNLDRLAAQVAPELPEVEQVGQPEVTEQVEQPGRGKEPAHETPVTSPSPEVKTVPGQRETDDEATPGARRGATGDAAPPVGDDPTDPVAPAQPAAPVEPVLQPPEPVEAPDAEPVAPAQPAAPVQPVAPADPPEQVEPPEPVDPPEQVEPPEPVEAPAPEQPELAGVTTPADE